ncbi:MAG: ATP-binding cassette domain-containing protein, partial [Pseudomonadota bacterium]
MNEIVLKLEDIVKTYKTRATFFGATGQRVIALNQVGLEISKGEIFGLVGESGSGKTTAGRLIVGLEAPDSGKMSLNGEDITGLRGRARKDFRRRVQMIFQDPYQSLNPQLSVFDTISEPLIIHKMGRFKEREEKVEKV